MSVMLLVYTFSISTLATHIPIQSKIDIRFIAFTWKIMVFSVTMEVGTLHMV